MDTLREALRIVDQYDRAGQAALAEDVLRQILQANPRAAIAHYRLGQLALGSHRYEEAESSFRRASELDPDVAECHAALARALERQGKHNQAESSFRKAIELDDRLVDAWLGLGILWEDARRLEEAAGCFRRLTAIEPSSPAAHNNLGGVLEDLGHLEEALASYRKAAQLAPHLAGIHCNLGMALIMMDDAEGAIAPLREAIRLQPDYVDAYRGLGRACARLLQLEAAARAFQQALRIAPDDAPTYNTLADIYEHLGRRDEAERCRRLSLQLQPAQPLLEMRMEAACPVVFQSDEEIRDFRARYLADLQRRAATQPQFEPAELLLAGIKPAFALQFHGRCDREIRETFARMIRHSFPSDTAPPPTGKPKIGFVVTNLHESAFTASLGGVLDRLDPARFELYVFCSRQGQKKLDENLRNPSLCTVVVEENLDQAADRIRSCGLDILYYWEIGTDSLNYLLPFYRLARVQCSSWGVQGTAGIPNVDYYISSRLVEPHDAADHYSEQLLLTSTLLSYQFRRSLPDVPTPREAFGLRDEQRLYVCAQQIGKFHPDFDPILAEILRRDPLAIVVGVRDTWHSDSRHLLDRFSRRIPDVADRIQLLPRQENEKYLSLVAAADVVLDPPHFSGVNSSYDAFSIGQPIVSLPSSLHRGRYTLGCYDKMGITEFIASDAEDYVRIALALGMDLDYRAAARRSIAAASDVLFEDIEAVREHERAFEHLVRQAREGG